MSDAQILVLGSEGAIGTRLIAMLRDFMPSANLVRVSKSRPDIEEKIGLDNNILIGDLLDPNFVNSIFEENHIEVIIFCAAKWNGLNNDPSVLDINVTMINNLLLSLPGSVRNFIYLSSSAVYGDNPNDDMQNVSSLPNTTYGKSKLISETLLANKAELENFSTIIYRPFHVVSPAEKYLPGRSHITTDFACRYVELGYDFEWQSLRDDVYIPFYWVDDLCRVIVENMFNEQCSGKIFNIGTAKSYSILDLAKSIASVSNKYGLSSRAFPPINGKLLPVDNGFSSQLDLMFNRSPDRDLLDIIELFIIEKYRAQIRR
ncbi:NAD-dependent epimerase/dehydratase family protein [Alphaproteobacteria bacterium]|nr:NAD-dependent epimerase/dehydratase family protein [Alphaproteobacteria bacterium]MDB2656014.1 NAD-dependent epimerase/dehydratase family protein [Alphaproteobacteria bacterium]